VDCLAPGGMAVCLCIRICICVCVPSIVFKCHIHIHLTHYILHSTSYSLLLTKHFFINSTHYSHTLHTHYTLHTTAHTHYPLLHILPPHRKHVFACVALGQEMIKHMLTVHIPVRCGVHTGKAIAGVGMCVCFCDCDVTVVCIV
jgi:hypothetical protein